MIKEILGKIMFGFKECFFGEVMECEQVYDMFRENEESSDDSVTSFIDTISIMKVDRNFGPKIVTKRTL